jgi:hypothetical protein
MRRNVRLIFNRKFPVAHRAIVFFGISDADHPRSAERAFPPVLSHAHKRPIKRSQNSEQDERNAEENTPPRKAKHYAGDDQNWSGDHPNVHSSECPFRRHRPMLAVYMHLVLDRGAAPGTEAPHRRHYQSTFHTMSVHREPLLFGHADDLNQPWSRSLQPETLRRLSCVCP